MKVDFLIVGTQKGGTSALFSFLSQHPNILMPVAKELHFFDNEDNFNKDYIDYSEYHANFQPNMQQILLGEATPIYMYWKPAAGRIYEYNPNIKLIFILRNPVERAYSSYIMQIMNKKEFLPFWVALLVEHLRHRLAYPLQSRQYSYIDRGFYSKSIKRFLELFPSNQLLFIKTEDLLLKHQQTLNGIFEFLEVPIINSVASEVIFSNTYPSIGKYSKWVLQKKYFKEIEKLEKILSWDLTNWKK